MAELPADGIGAPRHVRHGRVRPGEFIGGRYRLESLAGAGGMATVWRAYDERLERTVAIKVISDALAANPSAVTRFAREARTHAGIQHPNLVQVYDYSISSPQPYLVMEYVDGETLSQRLDRGEVSAAAVETLARELLSAIACVHDHGVLHRDIKPGNVLLDGQGNARLTDFGLARLDESTAITRPDEIVGTLLFLAPELLQGQQATRQSDLFALGVVLSRAIEATAAGPRAESGIGMIVTWLTMQDPAERPPDAHAVLTRLSEEAEPARRPNGRHLRAARRPEPTPLMRTLVGEPPTEPIRREDAKRGRGAKRQPRRPPGRWARARLAERTALAAAVVVVVVVALMLVVSAPATRAGHPAQPISAVTGSSGSPHSSTHAHPRSGAASTRAARRGLGTVDQQLATLAGEVRSAAGG